jgi:hypothetical protein
MDLREGHRHPGIVKIGSKPVDLDFLAAMVEFEHSDEDDHTGVLSIA